MEGVTTAIVGFILAALAFPNLIRHRSQYFAALGAVGVVIVLDALAHVIHSDGFDAFAYFFCALMQVCAVGLLVMSAGGLSMSEFKDEIGKTIEVIRRGEEEKEVIIPLSEEAKATIRANAEKRAAADEAADAGAAKPETPKDPLPLV